MMMKARSHLPCCLILLATAGVGCSGASEGDTSPPPAKDPQTGASQAVKGIESSSMSPEQKQAAADYMKQGAAGAEKMKANAPAGGPGQK